MAAKDAQGFSEALWVVFEHSDEFVATKQDSALSENSTKQELNLLRTELNGVKIELKPELKSELKNVRSEQKSDIFKLQSEMVMWIVGLLFAQTAIIVSIINSTS